MAAGNADIFAREQAAKRQALLHRRLSAEEDRRNEDHGRHRQEQRRHCTAAARNALPKEVPDGTPLGERFTGPDRPKDADGKEEGARSAASFDLVVQRLLGGAESAGPSTPEFSQRADNHQQGERHPEHTVLPAEREINAEPEPLIRMQQPREEEDDNSREDRKSTRLNSSH